MMKRTIVAVASEGACESWLDVNIALLLLLQLLLLLSKDGMDVLACSTVILSVFSIYSVEVIKIRLAIVRIYRLFDHA
jgi:hypothetical protein